MDRNIKKILFDSIVETLDEYEQYKEKSKSFKKEEYKDEYEHFIIEIGERFDGERIVYQFPNNYGASVVRNPFSYGGRQGFYEVGILYKGDLTHHSEFGDDGTVAGWLTWEDVFKVLTWIQELEG